MYIVDHNVPQRCMKCENFLDKKLRGGNRNRTRPSVELPARNLIRSKSTPDKHLRVRHVRLAEF